MHQPINQVRLRGFLVGAAHLFVSRSGQARVAFRLEVWNDDHQPASRKVPAGVDYFSIITFGVHKVLLPQLSDGREVFITGQLRSRDVDLGGKRRSVTEVVAHEIIPLKTRLDAISDHTPEAA